MDPNRPNPASLVPLSAPVQQILLTLGNRDLHGYAIMRELDERTGGRETLLPGTLYSSIARMVAQGLIGEVPPPEGEGSGGPRRRYYRATDFGRQVAAAELERMKALLDVARASHLLPQGRG